MKKNDLVMVVLALVMLINALGSGIIFPLLYPYATKFGISSFWIGVLFASYSFFQFLATPIIGRLSDRFGRKPLLLLSLLGTSLSLVLFALAKTAIWLFIARALDGITGGNNSVAQAMIADVTKGKDRAKRFGVLGAMFGFGMLIGPAIGGFMSEISLSAPFWLASFLALLSTVLGFIILEETLTKKIMHKQKSEPLFNYQAMIKALFHSNIGYALLLTFTAYFAQQSFSIGFQAYVIKDLLLTPKTLSSMFVLIGLILILVRTVGIRLVVKRVSDGFKIIRVSFLVSILALLLMSLSNTVGVLIALVLVYIGFYSLISPVIAGLISKTTNEEDQGIALGINQSYMSLGQIFGPVTAGMIAQFSIKLVFVWSAFIFSSGLMASFLMKQSQEKLNL